MNLDVIKLNLSYQMEVYRFSNKENLMNLEILCIRG